ncbi:MULTISPECIES: alpha/beta hydrolase [unclassified Pasteurella]|uniref:alpha/beta hydrolase n=1 Tax=unclassified Pasteurella TaxID=2621516 RepID=UPI00107311D7|nr:alpha/beta hydrolase [Pasteurella sp. 19428wF3_WM03]TFU52438.1 alpha/beta hydrolase [Pasteurella sp. WM03]
MTKTLFKKTALAAILGSALLAMGSTAVASLPQNTTAIEIPAQHIPLVQEWDKTFPKSDKVEHRKITFKNRYGITLAADLYVPKNAKGKLPAIAVSGPFGAVKEQSSGLYAQTLAERGFVTLAFDGSYTGESGGEPRNIASPEIATEDFSAAVDFLGTQDFVNRDAIGILGICGWGGFALNAAVADTRVKAVAVSTMYDMTKVMANGYEIDLTPNAQGIYDRKPALDMEGRYQMKQGLNFQRWRDAETGNTAYTEKKDHLPAQNEQTVDTPKMVKEYADYYKTARGYHPRSVNSNGGWSKTTPLAFINMPILQRAGELKSAALVVHGEKAHSRYFGEEAFQSLGSKNKELYIVPNATHVDLYDNQAGKIPYDKFEAFFKANLK